MHRIIANDIGGKILFPHHFTIRIPFKIVFFAIRARNTALFKFSDFFTSVVYFLVDCMGRVRLIEKCILPFVAINPNR